MDTFIRGETIDLCVPDEDSVKIWYKWFNDLYTCEFLDQGIYPNTYEKQLKYWREMGPDRMCFLVVPKFPEDKCKLPIMSPKISLQKPIGVCSLSGINMYQRRCTFALVIGNKIDHPDRKIWSMEAKALITEHAFDRLGVRRVESGQALPLKHWQAKQIIFGYHMEGIKREAFIKGDEADDVMISGCILRDYRELKAFRGGSIWPGKEVVRKLMDIIPDPGTIENLGAFIRQEKKINADYIRDHENRLRVFRKP